MRIYDQIKDIDIKNLDHERLQRWITDEIEQLADDYGQNIDSEQVIHISKRLKGLFIDSKIKNWSVASIHSIFQNGINGIYGKSGKITFHLLNSWIWSYDRNSRSENKSNNDVLPNDEKDHEYYKKKSMEWIPFIRFCQDKCIAVHELTEAQHMDLKERFHKKGPQSIEFDTSIPRYSLNGTKVNI